jgi:hypothetical protein
MTIETQLEKLTTFFPLDRLKELLKAPLHFMPEPPNNVVPSLELAGDGRVVRRLILISERYLCEVHLGASPFAFDYIDKATVKSYRFRLWTHEIKEGETSKQVYHLAQVDWVHTHFGYVTQLSFVGSLEERDEWLANMIRSMPVTTIL